MRRRHKKKLKVIALENKFKELNTKYSRAKSHYILNQQQKTSTKPLPKHGMSALVLRMKGHTWSKRKGNKWQSWGRYTDQFKAILQTLPKSALNEL